MKIEFTFNSTTTLRLSPECPKDKQLIALFSEGAVGLKLGAGSVNQPDSLVIERLERADFD